MGRILEEDEVLRWEEEPKLSREEWEALEPWERERKLGEMWERTRLLDVSVREMMLKMMRS